jgi:hypothetical protein
MREEGMTTDIGMRMQRLIASLTDKHFTYPPHNIGLKTALAAKQAGYIEIQTGFKTSLKCSLTSKGVTAQRQIKRHPTAV